MYSVVLMAALTAGSTAPAGHKGFCWGCTNSWAHSAPAHVPYGPGFGYGASSWMSGCLSCYGGCFGNPYGCHGCYGCFGCYGCAGYAPAAIGMVPTAPYMTAPAAAPAAAPVETAPSPKEKDKDKDKKAALGNAARLIVHVPADAKLFVDNQLTAKTNARRVFETPDLAKGTAYYYVLRAEVTRDGETHTSTKRVIVRGGDQVTANFEDLDKLTTAKAESDEK